MPRLCYQDRNFSDASLEVIEQARAICEDYEAQGYDLTLRQLYYQFVSRDLLANKQTEYKRLGSIINDARLAGLIDWDHITDRTRNLRDLPHWSSPASIVSDVAHQFRIDKWATQDYRVEVWIEKDALVGVLETACEPLDVPYFSCRGYTSQSEVWGAAQRLGRYIEAGQNVVVLHLGDHDPSGVDMSRDIEDRLNLFLHGDGLDEGMLEVNRIALNIDQVRRYNPPPNPAKMTDSRSAGYVAEFGNQSWELDALDPATLTALIQTEVAVYRSEYEWDQAETEEATHKRLLRATSDRWADVVELVS